MHGGARFHTLTHPSKGAVCQGKQVPTEVRGLATWPQVRVNMAPELVPGAFGGDKLFRVLISVGFINKGSVWGGEPEPCREKRCAAQYLFL